MSEEKIIKEVSFITKWISKIGLIKEREAIQGLLDLYNTEKEKNASLQKEIKEYKIQEDLTFKCLDKTKYMSNFISKDKIRAKIKEIERKDFENEINFSEYHYKTEVLIELLEEE